MDIYASFLPKTQPPLLNRFAELTMLKLGIRFYWDQNGIDLDELEKNNFIIPDDLSTVNG